MSASGVILSRSAKRDERASDRTAAEVVNIVENYPEHENNRAHRPLGSRTDGRATDVEIAHLQKLAADLATGLRNLRALRSKAVDFDDRILKQKAKMRSVEKKLFRLRQARLL